MSQTLDFAEVYDQFYSPVYNFVRYQCSDQQSAEDLTAQIFEQILTHLTGFDPQRGALPAWVFSIARNALKNHFRAQALRRFLPLESAQRLPEPEPGPEDQSLDHETREKLLSALSTLPQRERELLALKFAARFTNQQISSLTGLSESNVGVIIFRAVRKLQQLMEM